jgi:hypothetical protein
MGAKFMGQKSNEVKAMMMSTEDVLKAIRGVVICEVQGEKKIYPTGAAAAEELGGLRPKYNITSISAEDGNVVLTLEENKVIPNDMNADWVKEYIEKNGEEPGFF